MAGRTEEHGVARRLAAIPVAAWIVLTVRLRLDDAPSDSVEKEGTADEVAGDLQGGAGEERLGGSQQCGLVP